MHRGDMRLAITIVYSTFDCGRRDNRSGKATGEEL